jgi:hypothetical protein
MIPSMPYVPDTLTSQEERELKRWEDRLAKIEQERDETRRAYAAWIRETGVSAVARELGVPPGRLEQRVRLYEGKRRRRGSR